MTSEPLLWTDIQACCRDAFRREPVLEMALGDVYREVYGTLKGRDEARRRGARATLKTMVYPYFYMVRNILSGLDERRLALLGDREDSTKVDGAFVITEPRDNNWGCIFPVLRRFDELGHTSVLFLRKEVWDSKVGEIRLLRHCRVIAIDLLKYMMPPLGSFAARRRSRSMLELCGQGCESPEVRAFISENRARLSYALMDILQTSDAVERILSGKGSRFILTMGVPPAEFRWALAGRRLGIRTYVISHGFVAAHRLVMHFSPSNSDEIILWGPISEPEVRKVCGPDHPISVLGNPAYDTLINDYLHKEPDPSVLIPLGFRRDALTLVFFSGTHAINGDDEKHIAPIRALSAVKRTFGDRVNVVVKLHPHEGREHYVRHLGEDIGGFIIVKGELPLFQLMGLADVAASIDSTTLVEAMVMGVPTLQLSLSEHGVVADYHEHGATILMRKEDELLGLIERALSGDASMWTRLKEAQARYVSQYLVNLGTATERYVEHLLETDGGDAK